jgi:thiol:disulfide interchange protein/DsbC/DsbD-like thiol-disulfide interchange protein
MIWRMLMLCGLLSQGLWAKDFSSWHKYTQAELVSETNAFAPGNQGAFGLKIKLVPPWHTYWLNPGDSGTPIHLRLQASRGLSVQRALFPLPTREITGPLVSFVYENEVLIPIEAQVSDRLKPGEQVGLTVDAEWLVCAEVCIPAMQTFHLDVPIVALEEIKPGADFALFQKTRAMVPEKVPDYPRFQTVGEQVVLPVTVGGDEFVDFFPFRTSGVNNVKPIFDGKQIVFAPSPAVSAAAERVGVLLLKSHGVLKALQFGESGWNFEGETQAAPPQVLWWILLSAFLGGLILNLMPCVFPILSIKLLSLLKLAHAHPGEVRRQNFAYVAGVLVSFVAIALVLSVMRSAGHLVGWGFQLQSPVFLLLLCWLFFALTLNLLGIFELELLNPNWGHQLVRLGGLWGSFFTGVLAVVVASPCTAPFMGVALGFGLSQSTGVLIAVFLMLGLGLAFPYLLFALFPQWVRFMPRPGLWMKIVKQVMAVPLLLTTLWMLWLLYQSRGNSALAVALLGAVVLCGALIVGQSRWLWAAVALCLPLGVVYIFAFSEAQVRTESADNQWQSYSDARLASLKGQNVFINMTADWCLTCKVNERLVFDDDQVHELLRKKNVVWLKGDWTQRNEEITRFLNRFERVGVPFYVLYSPHNSEGRALPEVLTKTAFIDYINSEFP